MIKEVLKYVDLYGIKLTFFTDKRRKLYTSLGGILSILTIILYISLFILISIDDFKHETPITTKYKIPSLGYHKIKFGREKIWIPWRIRDYNLNFINHTNILYPIVNYYYSEKNLSLNESLEIKKLRLNYTLCNETSMINKSNIYNFDIPLNELYCIEMGDIFMEGNLMINLADFIKFDLYLCKNGIPYDEKNDNCTTVSQLKKIAGINNSWLIELFYPIVQFQPTDIQNPIIIIYKNHFYHLSKYSNKIERIFLQEYTLQDDTGWFIKNYKNYSFWGFSSVDEDSYFSTQSEDIINEGNSSRIYSFNIYLEPGIILYKRHYKKILKIIAEGLPICNSVIIFFKILSNLFQISDSTKKLTELLFENIQENKRRYKLVLNNEGEKKIRGSTDIYNYQFKRHKMKLKSKMRSSQKSPIIKLKRDKILFDNSFSAMISKQNELTHNKIIDVMNLSNILKENNKENNKENVKENNQKNNPENNNFIRSYNSNKFIKTPNQNYHHLSNASNNNNCRLSSHKNDVKFHSHKLMPTLGSKIIGKSLFPYRYYFFSLFIKNIKMSKDNHYLFSKKYINVYNFICQFFDISTYVVLLREFNLFKNALIDKKILKIIESKRKINVNDVSLIKDIGESNNRLRIFSKSIITKNNHPINRESI